MRRGVLFLSVLVLGVQAACAQTLSFSPDNRGIGTSLFQNGSVASSLLSYDLVDWNTNRNEGFALSNGMEVRGPVVHVLKAKKLGSLPKRLLDVINPFRKQAPEREIESKGVGGLSYRAWTTTAGWHPGDSALTDPATHPPMITLISLNPAPH